jgi:peptide methionine sulfoxide reductase MsrA
MRFIQKEDISDKITSQLSSHEVTILGGGCFWCIEGALQQLPGIIEIRSGYM